MLTYSLGAWIHVQRYLGVPLNQVVWYAFFCVELSTGGDMFCPLLLRLLLLLLLDLPPFFLVVCVLRR